jgi:stage V sporulation protein D (sporulation-specific penicillin-binding protein)
MQSAQRISNLALKRRMELAFLGFMLAFTLLAGRLAWIQWWRQGHYARLANLFHVRTIPAAASRGAILARDGQELASNILARDVCANPRIIADPDATGRALAEMFGGDAAGYAAKIRAAGQSAFVYLKRGVDREKADRCKSAIKTRADLKGVELRPAPRRTYPGGMLAAAVLGYVDIDGKGIEGLERYYDRVLAGRDGHTVADVDAKQDVIPGTERQAVPPVDGQDLKLTVDAVIQQFAEQELQKAVEQYSPDGATAIVMEIKSGEVLALANAPGYDPNMRGKVPADNRRCRAITDMYEPGSTFKLITAAAALEEHIRTDAYCSGSKVVGPHVFHCAHGHAHGQCDLERIIEQSCNIGAATLAERLGAEALYRHVRLFGFGEKTGVELAGEAAGGWMGKWEDWTSARTQNIGFGQGITATPLQMIRAYAALANDGLMVRPRIVAAIGGKPLESQKEPRRVVSVETARRLQRCMGLVVTDGTGKAAKIAHYSVAGKTGTAQIAQGGRYASGAYVASFIGFLPASKPRLAILVAVRHPVGAQYGGTVAAPVFREIARQTMNYLQIPPDAPNDERDGAILGSFEKWKRQNGESEPGKERSSD